MDRQGVDVHVIFPSLFLALAPERPETELAITRAYNRFLAERCAGSNCRLRWVMQPSVKNIEKTVEDIRWARQHGAIGVHLRGLEGNRPIDDPDFYPIFEVAQELDMPICVHIGNASAAFRQLRRNKDNKPSRWHMSVPTLMSFTALCTSEVSAKFPRLRFGFFEIGSAWLTYVVTQAHRVRDERDRKAVHAVRAARAQSLRDLRRTRGTAADPAVCRTQAARSSLKRSGISHIGKWPTSG
jgi:uncharacterized protein